MISKAMELKVSNHNKAKLSYTSICNYPINLSLQMKIFPYKFKIPKIDKFKGKEDPRENLWQFKYSYYIILSDDVVKARNFSMMLVG